MAMTWRDNAGRILLDPTGPAGEPIDTPLDRRWLWRIETFLAVSGTTEEQRRLGRDLSEYLHETCTHHWMNHDGDEVIAGHRQCLWCNDVDWQEVTA